MGEIKNVATLTDDVQANINRSAIEFRASWMALIYDELKKDGIDPEPAIRRAIWKCGKIHGENYKAACANPDDCRDFANVFLNELGRKTFEKEIIEMKESEVLVDFHYCPLVKAWQKQGCTDEEIERLCDMAMCGDRGIASAYGARLELPKTIAHGDSHCEIRFKKGYESGKKEDEHP